MKMNNEIKWRFPGNRYTNDNGLDTADMETFKKDAISSLARELCQNSIDAKRFGVSEPVKIVFKSFSVNRSEIPDIDVISSQIDDCIETWQSNKKIFSQLREMKSQIEMDTIQCLRISDFNTTGLVGVSGDDKSPWRYLVHGSGISDKSSTSGGSKGIGKFATFVTSHFNTVFYSTLTEKGESGYEGICKLCSAKMPNTTEKTQGIGYFGSSDMNEPISGQFKLDSSFSRKFDEYGSDVFIIGFKEPMGWKKDIITKILDSFMSAIVFKALEIEVDEIKINFETLKSIVYSEDLINKKDRKNIISQFLLLTDEEHRFEDIITIDGFGEAKLFLLEFDSEHEDMATNGCVMIRYPYMKIKDLQKISTLPCSAMCIIENNDLNSILRNVENPQHTNWEFNRIEDPSERQEVKGIYDELLENIRKIITDHLASSDNTKTDIEGAGDYIPGIDNELGKKPAEEKKKRVTEEPSILKKKIKPKEVNINASVPDENGDGIELDIGETSDEGEITLAPEGHNEGSGGNVRPGKNQGTGKSGDDGHILVKHAELRGMSYRFFCLNKKERKYAVTFVSDFDEDDVRLELNLMDDSGSRYPVKIEKCLINGNDGEIEEDRLVKFSIKHGEKIKIELVTDQEEMFSGEVKVYAYR